jgi:hypothetical protein
MSTHFQPMPRVLWLRMPVIGPERRCGRASPVDVNERAGVRAFLTRSRRLRFEFAPSAEAGAAQHAEDGGAGNAEPVGDQAPCAALPTE